MRKALSHWEEVIILDDSTQQKPQDQNVPGGAGVGDSPQVPSDQPSPMPGSTGMPDKPVAPGAEMPPVVEEEKKPEDSGTGNPPAMGGGM